MSYSQIRVIFLLYCGNPMTSQMLDWKIQPNLTLLKQFNMYDAKGGVLDYWVRRLGFSIQFQVKFSYKSILAKDLFNLGITEFQMNCQKVSKLGRGSGSRKTGNPAKSWSSGILNPKNPNPGSFSNPESRKS